MEEEKEQGGDSWRYRIWLAHIYHEISQKLSRAFPAWIIWTAYEVQ